MENPVIIIGASGLGAVALDIFKRNNVVVYAFWTITKSYTIPK
jgi:hypothetical protein